MVSLQYMSLQEEKNKSLRAIKILFKQDPCVFVFFLENKIILFFFRKINIKIVNLYL